MKGKFVWLAIAFALTLVHASWHPFPSYLQKCFAMGFSLSGVFYFSAGIFLGLYDASAVRTRPAALSIPFVMYAVWYFIPSSKWPTGWTSCSFPLFVMHMSIMPFFVAVLKRTPLGATQSEGVAVFIGATAASIGIALMLRRFFPRVNAFLFAGRS